ncbi:hypothetical protein SMSP2_01545 [Limihaloglobus sulfuriphilus]|uniref:Uncharacterized protein n=1 Tax=Limihaloglobus sulfuriphilus TaxID=1851148 RepID=A0A1Q2MEU7_9BACT|nr:hypothetical protein [Limihaloglobus sulfuriphilus]AQQ71179.1 hypothetical protein SMSP2_01545 [Limihaloglobus sulfuriphilus]
MGRKRVDIEYKGVVLRYEDGRKVIRVRRDVKKNQNLTNYKLEESDFRNKTNRLIYQSTNLGIIASEFFKYILLYQKRNSIEISPLALSNSEETEIEITWFDIKERSSDESTIKYIAYFLDGLDDSYFDNLKNMYSDFRFDYKYIYSNELIPYSSRSYKVFAEVSEYLEDYPNCNQAILPAIARVSGDKCFAFYAFDDEEARLEIKKDIVRLCNKRTDLENVWQTEGLRAAFEEQAVEMKANIENNFATCRTQMKLSLNEKKKEYLATIPPGKIISLENHENKEVETHEEFVEYIDSLVSKYGEGVDCFRYKIGEDLKKHYLEGKSLNDKLRITVEDFYEQTNQYYINRAVECLIKKEKQQLLELEELLSHRAKFEKYTERYYSNVRFKLLKNGSIIKFNQHITKDFIVRHFINILKEDSEFVVTLTGVDEFKQLSDSLNRKILTLDILWEYYRDRDKYTMQNKLSSNWIKRIHAWFIEFKKIVDVSDIDDLGLPAIQSYCTELNRVLSGNYYPKWISEASEQALRKKKATKKWAIHRLKFISSMFKNAQKVNPDLQLEHLVEYIEMQRDILK